MARLTISTQISGHLGGRRSTRYQPLSLSRTSSREAGYHFQRLPSPDPKRHISRWRPLIIGPFKPRWSHHPLAWKDLSNLATFELSHIPASSISVTQLLDFFKSTPLLRTITLEDSLPTSSNAPPGRIVSLPHMEELKLDAEQSYLILLNHLSIPSGALLVLEFEFGGDTSPLPDYLPKPSENIKTLLDVSAINLRFRVDERLLRLAGPGGETYIYGHLVPTVNSPPHVLDCKILRSLEGQFYITDMLSMAKERARRGAKLSSIAVGLGELASGEVFNLREHVAHVDYMVDDVEPEWCGIPGDVSHDGYESA